MWSTMTLGTLAGLLFGVIFIWQGVEDAFLVLLFAAVGWLIGFAALLTRRVVDGQVDPNDIRSLFGNVVNGRGR